MRVQGRDPGRAQHRERRVEVVQRKAALGQEHEVGVCGVAESRMQQMPQRLNEPRTAPRGFHAEVDGQLGTVE